MISRCLRCNGKKTVMGLGSIHKECDECFGIGHVDYDVKVPIIQTKETVIYEKPSVSKKEMVQKRTNKEKLTVRIRKDGSPKRAYNRKVKVG